MKENKNRNENSSKILNNPLIEKKFTPFVFLIVVIFPWVVCGFYS